MSDTDDDSDYGAEELKQPHPQPQQPPPQRVLSDVAAPHAAAAARGPCNRCGNCHCIRTFGLPDMRCGLCFIDPVCGSRLTHGWRALAIVR